MSLIKFGLVSKLMMTLMVLSLILLVGCGSKETASVSDGQSTEPAGPEEAEIDAAINEIDELNQEVDSSADASSELDQIVIE